MFETSKSQYKFLITLVIFLTVALIAIGGYYLYYTGAGLPFFSSKKPSSLNNPNSPVLVDTTRIDNCTAQKETDPLVGEAEEIVPGIMGLDFRGKVSEIVPGDKITNVKLTALSGQQTYQFQIDNTEPVYGKQKTSLSDLKNFDELLIAVNCKKGENGTLKYSKIYKIEK